MNPAGKRRMIVVDFAPGSPPRIGHPRQLFEFDSENFELACRPVRCYDVAPDGQRFFTVQLTSSGQAPMVTHISLVLNWFQELKANVPPGR